MFNRPPYINREIIKTFPREALLFAIDYFKGEKINVCEIGVWYGRNSRMMNDNLNINKLYLIDPYFNAENAKNYAHKRNKKGNEIWIKKKSEDSIEDVEMLDFIYIDGLHTYKQVKMDLELYWNKLKDGGIMSGHDIHIKGISDAIIEFVKKNNLDIHFGDRRDWWIIKNSDKEREVKE